MTKREKVLLTFAAILAVVCGYVFLVQNISADIATAQLENETLELQREEAMMSLDLIPTYESALEENTNILNESKAKFGEYLLNEDVQLLFTGLAKDNMVKPLSIFINDNTTNYVEEEAEAYYFTAKEVSFSFTASITEATALIQAINDRTDTVLLNFSQSGTRESGSFTIQCVIFMQNNT